MKIEAKIQYYTLECICNLYDGIQEVHAVTPLDLHFTKNYKASKSVVSSLILKFKKQLLSKASNCKPFKISLEYYQAYFLITFISAYGDTFYKGILELTLLSQFIEKLDRQL